MKRRRKGKAAGVFLALLGFLCALVLGAVFYGTMVYQLAGEASGGAPQPLRANGTPAPLAQGESAQRLFPGPLLALGGAQLTGEEAQDVRMGGETCRVVTRTYALEDGSAATVISATPASYLERLREESWQPQLITGFVLGEMDAVYALRGETGLLAARSGDFVYMLMSRREEQALYALGAQAALE